MKRIERTHDKNSEDRFTWGLSIHVNYRFIQLGFLLKFESAYFGLFTQNSVLGFENVLFVRSIL